MIARLQRQFDVLLQLYRLLSPWRRQLLLTAVAVIVSTAASLVPPYVAAKAIDDGIVKGDVAVLDEALVVLVVAVALYSLTATAQTYASAWIAQRALASLRSRMFAHLQVCPGLLRLADRRPRLPHHQRRRAARKPCLRCPREHDRQPALARRHAGRDVRARRGARPGRAVGVPGQLRGHGGMGPAGPPPLPPHPRHHRRCLGLPAGDPRQHQDRPLVRPGATPPQRLRTAQRDRRQGADGDQADRVRLQRRDDPAALDRRDRHPDRRRRSRSSTATCRSAWSWPSSPTSSGCSRR